jgi:phosphosulfolactate synthase (CoM biosynthesis protein A)
MLKHLTNIQKTKLEMFAASHPITGGTKEVFKAQQYMVDLINFCKESGWDGVYVENGSICMTAEKKREFEKKQI